MNIPKEFISFLRNLSERDHVIDSNKFEGLFNNGEINKYYLLDIRERELYQKFKIPNSINIPFKQLGLELTKLPLDKEIIIICNSGFTAAQSLSLLNSVGFNTHILKDGINGYIEQGKNASEVILRTA